MFPIKRTRPFPGPRLVSLPVLAQKPPTLKEAEEKLRRNLALLEQILMDARGLKLPENRAFVSAKAGSVLWNAGPKRARQLFESAVTDLIAGQNEAEAERQTNSRNFQQMKYGQQPRWTILFMIGSCDAAFALEAMTRSRTPRLERAIADSRMGENTTARQFANEESQNEQRLIAMAADQDPALAIRQVRESLKRGVNYYTLSLLRKIASKNPEAAAGLAAEAIKKLLDDDFRVNAQSAETLSQFFNDAVREITAGGKGACAYPTTWSAKWPISCCAFGSTRKPPRITAAAHHLQRSRDTSPTGPPASNKNSTRWINETRARRTRNITG